MDQYYKLKKSNEAELIKKAHNDPEFEKLLLSNPQKALKEIGIEVPTDVPIEIIEENGSNIRYVHLKKNTKSVAEIITLNKKSQEPSG